MVSAFSLVVALIALPEYMDKPENQWTTLNTTLELTLLAEGVVDVMQTRWFLGRPVTITGYPEGAVHTEGNPMLGGRFPSAPRLYVTMASAMVLHAFGARVLPSVWREAWQIGVIGLEAGVINYNRTMVGGSMRLAF